MQFIRKITPAYPNEGFPGNFMATLVQAVRLALHYGETYLGVTDIFGEDVGPPLGGVFTATQGLKTAWNSPLDERGIVGTAMGIRGASMDDSVPAKVKRAREIIRRRGLRTEIEMDGGIRRETVPLIHAAGADWIVPGSLMFKEDPPSMRRWLASL